MFLVLCVAFLGFDEVSWLFIAIAGFLAVRYCNPEALVGWPHFPFEKLLEPLAWVSIGIAAIVVGLPVISSSGFAGAFVFIALASLAANKIMILPLYESIAIGFSAFVLLGTQIGF
ncbi:MAG: hypothetical protein ACE5DI_05235 [Candidatus Micrarchaeia archaeon]